MTESKKYHLVRGTAAALLLCVTVTVIAVAKGIRIRAIDRSNPSMPYLYSDMEMEPVGMPQDSETDVFIKLDAFDKKYNIDVGFVDFCASEERINANGTFLGELRSRLDANRYSDEMWADLTGYTFSVLHDLYTGAALSEDSDVCVLGDAFDQNKTVISILDGVPLDELFSMTESESLRLDAVGGVKYFISGGLKFAVCGADADIAGAKAVSDAVIAEAMSASDADALAAAGADVIFIRTGEMRTEYIGDTVVICGTESLYVSVTLAVGIDPIVRVYPTVKVGEGVSLADAEASAVAIADANNRSDSAYIDENGRLRRK